MQKGGHKPALFYFIEIILYNYQYILKTKIIEIKNISCKIFMRPYIKRNLPLLLRGEFLFLYL